MKTNQLILATAVALMAITSCDKPAEKFTEQNGEIGFNAVASMATKANNAIISGTTYADDNTFQVWGWQSQEGDYSEFTEGAASNFMNNLTIEWTKGAAPETHDYAWRNDDHYYYWPFTGKIGFLAIHPSTVAPTTATWDATNNKPQATIADYTISASNITTDLMFANNEGVRRADALPMVFKHALSQIVVKVKTDKDYTNDLQFDVDSVQFNNIDLSGDVEYKNGALTSASWTDNAAQTQDWMYYNTVLANIDDDPQIYGAAIVMIPQPANIKASALDSSDPNYDADDNVQTTITIGYSMQQLPKDKNAKISGTITVPAPWAKVKEGATTYDPAEAIPGWEPGKKYNYTLNFKLNEITFTPEVTDWIEVDVETINIYD